MLFANHKENKTKTKTLPYLPTPVLLTAFSVGLPDSEAALAEGLASS